MRALKYVLVIATIVLVGCTETIDYDDDDVAAIVKGKEITIGELRFLYPDKNVLERIRGTIKAKLVMHEAKEMDIDVSEEIKESTELMGIYPPKDAASSPATSTREFADAQAEKLGMEPEVYYRQYMEITAEQSAYMNAYIQEMLGEPEGNEDAIKAYTDEANQLLDDLVKENEDDVKILIK